MIVITPAMMRAAMTIIRTIPPAFEAVIPWEAGLAVADGCPVSVAAEVGQRVAVGN